MTRVVWWIVFVLDVLVTPLVAFIAALHYFAAAVVQDVLAAWRRPLRR